MATGSDVWSICDETKPALVEGKVSGIVKDRCNSLGTVQVFNFHSHKRPPRSQDLPQRRYPRLAVLRQGVHHRRDHDIRALRLLPAK